MPRPLRTTTIYFLCTSTFFFFGLCEFFFSFASRWICWRCFGFGGCFTTLRLVCRLRCFRVMPKRLMGCLFFFLSPAASLVWSWRQKWDSAAAYLSHVSQLMLLLPRSVLVGEWASDGVGGVAPQWEKEGTDRTIDVDPCPPCLGAATVPLYSSFLCVPCALMVPLFAVQCRPT
ncbi:hypothetical protein Tc00.1047053511771.60 [Trypanosoma cruzi]|uniref:Uncharacterized protein n=1 Tax=Trypanosoma cruzi (strain CL Brener) TaxID=353153 RepID=Q4DUJ5_TRYCC|nr:hypothetical protein Tc00.1047053511771.60 [Trypanosoma cruzi]EAN96191.1 hypothetical protein Tc00.1047053511771.60 [Trypanosoma cruzi]|eukprot:XP_818042.1 hypothetical protein [Trypanosoma cruzi strain CL Brener]